jgi:hypothetical protein
MAKKRLKFSDEVKRAVDESGLSRYRICKELGWTEGTMSRFMGGTRGLSTDYLDALAEFLDLHVVSGREKRKAGKT